MRPLALRTKLTLFYSITVGILLTGFALIYYNVLSVGLDGDLTQGVIDRTEGLIGYLHFADGKPELEYDANDPDELTFINTATRYYQIYEIRTGKMLDQSDEFRATTAQYSESDVAHYAKTAPSFVDVQTDEGKLRLRNVVVPVNGEPYLLVVGASLQTVDDTLDSFSKKLAWLIPTGVLLAALE